MRSMFITNRDPKPDLQRRRPLFILGLLFFFISSFPASALPPYFTDENQLVNYLAGQKGSGVSKIEFNCSGDFFSALKEDNFFVLYQVLVRSGIDCGQAAVSYNDLLHYVQLNDIRYTDTPWAACNDMDDVRRAVKELVPNQNGFILLGSPQLIESLSGGNTLQRILVRNGVESYLTSVMPDAGILLISGITYLPVPYAVAEDYAQFASAAAGFQAMGVNDFYIVFDPELFTRVREDPTQYTIMIGSSKLSNYRSSIDPGTCSIRFSDVTFTDAPREICRTVGDVPEAIKRMGTAGIRDFELIFPDTSVFEALRKDDFALLLNLEAAAGMSGGNISYSSSSDRIIFNDAVISANAVMLRTLEEAVSYTEAQVKAGEKDIHLFCTPELFDALMGDLLDFAVEHSGMNRIYDLVSHAGIFQYDLSSVRASHVINIHINRLYPGTAVMIAERSGNYDSLTSRELELRAAAVSAAMAARSDDPLQTARNIHDWICGHTTYVDDGSTDDDDNAIGAVLNGEANCDGYADAFYLIGSLAGLHIRYQHGDSYYKDPVMQEESATHLWNLLELNGLWHMVDVTWDDQPSGIIYRWFNVGRDVADETHFWNKDMTVELAWN